MMRAASALAVLFVAVTANGAEPERVTVAQLLAAPAKYHEHTVIVRGSWDCGFETSHFFDATHPGDVIWLQAAEQDVEHPDDKKLMLLQQLYHMHGGPDSTAPRVDVTNLIVEIEAVFSDWDTLESTKKMKAEAAKDGKAIVFGGFGHLGACHQQLTVLRVLWFRCDCESPADPDGVKKTGANQSVESNAGYARRDREARPQSSACRGVSHA